MAVGAHAPELNLQEPHQVIGGDLALVTKVAGVDVCQLLCQDEELLVGERLQVNDGSEHVRHVLAGKATLGQAAAQGLVAKDAATAVLYGLGRSSHDDAQVLRLSLERVVIHGEDLLVVVLARDGVGDFVQVDQLVDHDEHALVARTHQKARQQLDVVVPVIVSDDGAVAQLRLCLGLGAVLSAQPLDHVGKLLLVLLQVGHAVAPEHAGEVKAVDHLVQRSELLPQQGCLVPAGLHPLLDRGNPAVEDEAERAPLWAGLGRDVADELAIGGKPLALVALQAALRGEIRVCHHKALAHGVGANGLEQEALAGAIAAHEEAERRAAVLYEAKVREEGLDLPLSTDGDVGQADARHDAALERVDDDGGDALGNPGLLLCHLTALLPVCVKGNPSTAATQ